MLGSCLCHAESFIHISVRPMRVEEEWWRYTSSPVFFHYTARSVQECVSIENIKPQTAVDSSA